ncbi:hypothetical protein QBC37DRAFT_197618 [Rhypophila decipiens]|uniref:NTF2-like domain-containing protein n=1 Tax=Rhypophila decipiens TaxID=261697 RepID=A0AAN6Y3T9_9PEZI|nr:hypothetical protein QBC37DRAFT_197618 [Rhypophila decipiens]
MHLLNAASFLALAVTLPLTALASSTIDPRTICLLKPKVSGYPVSILGVCLEDKQANFIVEKFKSILTNPDRSAAKATAEALIAQVYVEESDSINILAGYTLGGPSFTSKKNFIDGVAAAPAIPSMKTLEVFHSCDKISWRWNVEGLGRQTYPVKGINTFVVDPCTGQIKATYIEFSSIAWGVDIGWTCTPPPAGSGPLQ